MAVIPEDMTAMPAASLFQALMSFSTDSTRFSRFFVVTCVYCRRC